MIDILKNDYQITIPDQVDAYSILKIVNAAVIPDGDGLTCLKNVISKVFRFLKISSGQEPKLAATCRAFLDKAEFRINKYSLSCTYTDLVKSFKEKEGVVISTIHGTKGEEYHTVIAYGLLNGYLPNGNLLRNHPAVAHEEANKLLYVLCSRAKKNIFLFSETGRRHSKTPTTELMQARCDYN